MLLRNLPELEAKNRTFEGGDRPVNRDCFQFVTQIGWGAFGKVYRASSKKTGKFYAIKILTKVQISSQKLDEQLRNEISILSKCDHDNIIRLHAAFEDASFVSLVLEIANGGSLYKRLQSAKVFTEAQASEVLGDVIRAIIYLHSMSPPVLHRDLKPENVLIAEDKFKIADFGWSNVEDEYRNTFCGTPDYLAPEMIRGNGHNDRLDVWTIGVLMYELLIGRPPFSPKEKPADKRLAQKMIEKNVLEGRIEFPRKVSPEAEACIRVLMSPNSHDRPAAKEIFALDFFKIHGQTLEGKIGRPEALRPEANPLDSSEITQLRALNAEYREKLQQMAAVNTSMTDLIKSKDQRIESLQRELELANQSKRNGADPRAFLSTREELGTAGLETLRQGEEIQKLQKQVQTLFQKGRELAAYISAFATINSDEEALRLSLEGPLCYEGSYEKLRILFKNYLEMKAASRKAPKPIFADQEIRAIANTILLKKSTERRPQIETSPWSTFQSFNRPMPENGGYKPAEFNQAHHSKEEIDGFLR